MVLINGFTRFGTVEGLGDEEIPWWLAPYVRDFANLAKRLRSQRSPTKRSFG